MALVVPDQSKILILQIINGQINASDMTLHLFDNNVTLSHTTSKSDFSSPNTDYTPKTMLIAGWNYDTSNPMMAMQYSPETFLFSSYTGTIYGYYVTHNSTNKLLWAENITPFNINLPGDSITITPRLEIL